MGVSSRRDETHDGCVRLESLPNPRGDFPTVRPIAPNDTIPWLPQAVILPGVEPGALRVLWRGAGVQSEVELLVEFAEQFWWG
jgi:hypothetical protein